MPQTTDQPTSTRPTLDQLFSIMGKGPGTNQWDIVCSYSLNQLNAALSAAYAETGKTIAKNVEVSAQRQDPFTGESFTISYNLLLGAPSLDFVAGVNGSCILTMPMESGSYTITPQGGAPLPAHTITPNTYNIVVELPLICLYGDESPAGSSGSIISFTPGTQQETQITLHFKTTNTTAWTIVPQPDPSEYDPLVTYFLPTLTDYFQNNIKEIDYSLAGLSNQTTGSSGDIVIEPLSFVFATSGQGDDAVLSLYIQTANSGNPAGSPTPSFQPGDVETTPVPQNYDTSLIFSRDFLQKVYLIPQLQQFGFLNVSGSMQPQNESYAGCTVSGSFNYTTTMCPSDIDFGMAEVNFDPVTLDFRTPASAYQFELSNSQLAVSVCNVSTVDWSSSQETPQGPIDGPSGTATVTISLDKQMDLSKIGSVTDEEISLAFSVAQTDYLVNTDPGTSNSCWNGHMGSKVTDGIQSQIGSVIPAISFQFSGMNFFKTTNLLFPGKKIIHLDPVQGIHVPCDLVLLGSFSPTTGVPDWVNR